jgi:hypothetical protein
MTFSIDVPAKFSFDLRYEMVSGGLMMYLNGLVDEGLSVPINRTYNALYGINNAWIDL